MKSVRSGVSSTFFKWIMLVPCLAVLAFVTLYPFGYAIWTSLYSWNLVKPYGRLFIGISNYVTAFHTQRFIMSLLTSLKFVGAAVSLEFGAGLILALLLNRTTRMFRTFRVMYLVPITVTPVIVGLTFLFFFNDVFGTVNYFLSVVGIPRQVWLANVKLALPVVVVADVWQWTPFMMMILVAGLMSIPVELYEATDVDGATRWQKFIHISLPLLRPAITVAILLRVIDAFKLFDIVWIMTKGGPGSVTETASVYTYIQGFDLFEFGFASAITVIILAVIIVCIQVLIKLIPKYS